MLRTRSSQRRVARRTFPLVTRILLFFLTPLCLGCSGPSAATPPTATVPAVSVTRTSTPTQTPMPTTTPIPTATPTLTPTPAPTVDLATSLQQIQANELGWILVLEYHLIEEPEDRWSRTPDNFRADVERLIADGYYPINLIDMALGHINVPAGKTPIVLTFDDSSSGQCRYLEDGTVDSNSACGILLEASRRHPDDWQPRATFFILLDVNVPDRVIFGQPEFTERKLRDMVGWGFEIGSHTISHFTLSEATPEQICWQLGGSEVRIEAMIPGYEVNSLSVPLGLYPEDIELLKSGEWEGQAYDFLAAVEVAGGPSPSPFSVNFDPYRIRRNQGIQEELDAWLSFFQNHPELRYISDGDPNTVAIPDPLPERLQEILCEDLPYGMVVLHYPPKQ